MKSKNSKLAIGLVIGIVVLVALVIAFIAIFSGKEAVIEEKIAQGERSVYLTLDAPGFGSGDSPIPMNVKGTDFNGDFVEETQFVYPDGSGLVLLPGKYDITVAASPLMGGGVIYNVPNSKINIDLPEGTSSEDRIVVEQPIEFTVIDAVNIGENEAKRAFDYALESGFDSDKAAQYYNTVLNNRSTAISQKNAEESAARQSYKDARQQAEGEAARGAAKTLAQ